MTRGGARPNTGKRDNLSSVVIRQGALMHLPYRQETFTVTRIDKQPDGSKVLTLVGDFAGRMSVEYVTVDG